MEIHKIIRSKRKSLILQIDQHGQLIIRAPLRVPNKFIQQAIIKKQTWILKKQQEMQEKQKQRASMQYVNGAQIPYLGKSYPLHIIENSTTPLLFRNAFFLSESHQHKADKLFAYWYKREAQIILPSLTKKHANKHQLHYTSIDISHARRSLGSCNRHGHLRFSWRILSLPLPLVEYIVVHELAHLKHLNHSKDFWAQVAKMLPDYVTKRRQLKKSNIILL